MKQKRLVFIFFTLLLFSNKIFSQEYCMPKFSWEGADHFAIDSVTFSNLTGYQVGSGFDYPIETPASAAPNYPQTYTTLYTGDTAYVIAGSSYDLSVSRESNDPPPMVRFVWFDWNQNGSFDDAGEEFVIANSANGQLVERTATVSIAIPLTASGLVRMRIRMLYDGVAGGLSGRACDSIHFAGGACGETEDYWVYVNTEDPNAIHKFEKNAFNIYPNPSSGLVTLNFTETVSENTEISIYNISGVVVLNTQAKKLDSSINIDISMLESGIYYAICKKISSKPMKIIKY